MRYYYIPTILAQIILIIPSIGEVAKQWGYSYSADRSII